MNILTINRKWQSSNRKQTDRSNWRISKRNKKKEKLAHKSLGLFANWWVYHRNVFRPPHTTIIVDRLLGLGYQLSCLFLCLSWSNKKSTSRMQISPFIGNGVRQSVLKWNTNHKHASPSIWDVGEGTRRTPRIGRFATFREQFYMDFH